MLLDKTNGPVNKSLLIGGLMISVMVFLCISSFFLPLRDPLAQDLRASLQPPGQEWFFGTDTLGRDILARIIYGSRISLAVGAGVLLFSTLLGTAMGAAAAYFGGITDGLIMRTADILMSFPPLVLAMIVMAFTGPGTLNLIGILVLIRWPQFARLVRGQALSVKNLTFVEAARVSGSGPLKIVIRHILPNCFSPVIAYGTMTIGAIIIDESALSFLGLGIQPPAPSWGMMLADAKNYISVAPWLLVFPGLAIMITVLGCNLLGDGLGIILNPKQYRTDEVHHANTEG
jgi:peptide/nickel transport system permease protein